MEQLSDRKNSVLIALDAAIQELEKKLAKYQPLIDELNQLRRTRMTLLSERSVTGGISSRTRLTMESVIQAIKEVEEPATVQELAEKLGVDQTAIRSHLNRHKDEKYRRTSDGWELIGESNDNEEEEE